MFMLDTDTCIYVMNRRDAELKATFLAVAREICISAITLAELCCGVEHSDRAGHNRRQLDLFLKDLEVRAFDQVAGKHYGDIREFLMRRGTTIGGNGLFIAAHARSMAATLVTNNGREFGRVPELRTVNWVSGRAG